MPNILQPQIDGPLKVEGELEFVDRDGALIEKRDAVRLCRCGQSATKPFCDGSHKKAGFRDAGQVSSTYQPRTLDADVDPFETRLTIFAKTNGPLRCVGEMQVNDAGGAVAWSGAQANFCRCGASKNKPFCDGTHREIGFQAPY